MRLPDLLRSCPSPQDTNQPGRPLVQRATGSLRVLGAATIPLGALIGAVTFWIWRSPLWSPRRIDLDADQD